MVKNPPASGGDTRDVGWIPGSGRWPGTGSGTGGRSVVSSSLRPYGLLGFSKQEYWSGLPCPPPGDLPDPGIKPAPPALRVDSFTAEPLGEPGEDNAYM